MTSFDSEQDFARSELIRLSGVNYCNHVVKTEDAPIIYQPYCANASVDLLVMSVPVVSIPPNRWVSVGLCG